MNTVSIISQCVIPLGLLIWLYYWPLKSKLGFALQVLAIGSYLLAISNIAIWILPPWWTPYAYAVLLLTIVLLVYYRLSKNVNQSKPKGKLVWRSISFFSILAILSSYVFLQALSARSLPNSRVVDIDFPLSDGSFLIVAGGSKEIINQHLKTLNPNVEKYHTYRGQSYAIDIMRVNRYGFHTTKLSSKDPTDYVTFNTPIYAPCDGQIVASRSDRPDMPVGELDLDYFLGNFVVINCGEFEIIMAHFKHNSLAVTTGDQVTSGIKIGEIGNSGRSFEPHLHIHAQSPGTVEHPVSGEPIFLSFNGRYMSRNDLIKNP